MTSKASTAAAGGIAIVDASVSFLRDSWPRMGTIIAGNASFVFEELEPDVVSLELVDVAGDALIEETYGAVTALCASCPGVRIAIADEEL